MSEGVILYRGGAMSAMRKRSVIPAEPSASRSVQTKATEIEEHVN